MTKIFTIGHSSREIDDFIELLTSHAITHVVDIRTIPKSRHNPQYGQAEIKKIQKMTDDLDSVRLAIQSHESNASYTAQGYQPLFVASPKAKILIVGQAPGIRAQMSNQPWNDASGVRLVAWLGINEEQFRDPDLFAHLPMDFYYPGKGKSGDLPPRKTFAPLWHSRLRELMPDIELTILIGAYAQKYYLKNAMYPNLTETVRNYAQYLPDYFPVVHPSPLNFRWFAKNGWFEDELVPDLQKVVAGIIKA